MWTEAWWPFCPTRFSSRGKTAASRSCSRGRYVAVLPLVSPAGRVDVPQSFDTLLLLGAEVASSVGSGEGRTWNWQRSNCGAETGWEKIEQDQGLENIKNLIFFSHFVEGVWRAGAGAPRGQDLRVARVPQNTANITGAAERTVKFDPPQVVLYAASLQRLSHRRSAPPGFFSLQVRPDGSSLHRGDQREHAGERPATRPQSGHCRQGDHAHLWNQEVPPQICLCCGQ